MNTITQFFVQHLHSISIAIIATMLVIFGVDITRFVKRSIGGKHFLLRVGIFVLVCALGYGLATVFLAELLVKALAGIPRQFLAMSVVGIFLVLGLIAESRRQI